MISATSSNSSDVYRCAQGAAVFLSAFASGAGISLTAFAVPRLLASPADLMVTQWKRMYDRAAPYFVGGGVVSAIGYILAHYFAPGNGRSHVSAPLLGAALALSIIPYTLLTVFPTNRKLFALAGKIDSKGDLTPAEADSAKTLVEKWGLLHLGRPFLMGLSSLVGLVSLLRA